MRQFKKVNKFPILFFNTHSVNFIIEDIEKMCNNWKKKAIKWYNKKYEKNVLFSPWFFGRLQSLDFQSKFNVKLDKDIYTK